MLVAKLAGSVALTLIATYQLATCLVYAREERDRRLRYVNLLCACSAAAELLASGNVLVVVAAGADFAGICKLSKCMSVLLVTFSRCSAHFVFHSRCECLNRSRRTLRKLAVCRHLVVVLSLAQIAHASSVTLSFTDERCVGVRHSVRDRVAFCGLFTAILLLQGYIMSLIIWPIYAHYRGLRHTGFSDASVRRVLTRVCACTAIFVGSDLLVVLLAAMPMSASYLLPLCVSVSLIVNTTALQCSFGNYRRRLAPFRSRRPSTPPRPPEELAEPRRRLELPRQLNGSVRACELLIVQEVVWVFNPIYVERCRRCCDCASCRRARESVCVVTELGRGNRGSGVQAYILRTTLV